MDEATQKLVNDAVELATKGLAGKNKELIDEVKDSKKLLANFDGVDLKSLQAASKKLADIEAKKLEEDGEYKKILTKAQEDHKTETDTLADENKTLKQKLELTVKENALGTALAENKVIPELSKVAISTLLNEVQIDDKGIPVVGAKSVQDHVKKWAESDVGKHFIIDGNAGGGGRGSGGGGTVDEAKYFDPKSEHHNLTKQADIANKSPELYKTLKKQYGKPAES